MGLAHLDSRIEAVVAFPGGGLRLDRPVAPVAFGSAGREVLERGSHILRRDLPHDLFAGNVGLHPGSAQPALMVLWLARFADARAAGLEPSAVIGHSAGDWTAAVAAGVLDLADALTLLVLRGHLIEERCGLDTGTMGLIVGPSPAEVRAFVRGWPGVWIAAENGKRSITLSLLSDRVGAFADAVTANAFGEFQALPIPFASHTPLMAPVADELVAAISAVALRPPDVPLFSSTAALHLSDPPTIARALATNIAHPVRWWETVEQVRAVLPTSFVDLFPGGGMTTLLREAGVPRSCIHELGAVPSVPRELASELGR